jgi:hypothetical protein
MKATEIKLYKQGGINRDTVYEIAAGNMGLYGIAFFGHKGTPSEKQKLQRTWKRIMSEYSKNS